MPWLKLDDHLDDHPKLTRHDRDYDACLSTFVQLGLYCARNLTDGVVPPRVEARFDPRIIALLCEPFKDGPGQCERDQDGRLVVHDYLDYNPSKAEAEGKSASLSDRGKRGAEARWGKGERMATAMATAIAKPMLGKCPVPVPQPGTPSPVFESRTDSKTRPLSLEVPEDVLGYFADKANRNLTETDIRSLSTLVKNYGPGVVKIAIGQACVQGEAPDNFALVTTIARAEAS